jgi:hypothetical protein
MKLNWFDVIMFLLPYVVAFGFGFVVGFMSRNGTIDKLQATITRLTAQINGVEIRTGRTEPTEKPVRVPVPRTVRTRPEMPMYGPAHSATRTEPLPSGVQYVAAAEDDEPISDRMYADRNARYLDND